MEIHLKTDKSRYRFDETIRCEIIRTDREPWESIDGHCYCGFLIDGQTVYYEESENRDLKQTLFDYWDHIGSVHPIALQVEIRSGRYPDVVRTLSQPVRLEIDLTGIEVLRVDSGAESCYVRYRQRIWYIWPGSRGHHPPQRKLDADPQRARALTARTSFFPHYLVDGDTVYQDDRPVKGVRASGFRIFNPLFAGDEHQILTHLGDARVKDPASFEVLDDGNRDPRAPDWGAHGGHARDRQHGYWFDVSRRHAIVLRSCRHPATLVSLEHRFARDCEHAYYEEARIPGVDLTSWRILNALYSCDRRQVYYLNRKVAGADPASFTVIEDPRHHDPIAHSMWGRDHSGLWCRWERADPDEA